MPLRCCAPLGLRGSVSGCRCRSKGFPGAGYFDEVVSGGFISPDPVAPQPAGGSLTETEKHLLQQKIISGDIGLEASRAMLKAARVTGMLAKLIYRYW